jgi:acetyl esterase/lipase
MLLLAVLASLAPHALAADAPAAPAFGEDPLPAVALDVGRVANPIVASEAVHWFRPAVAREPLRVVVFLHGFGAQGPEPYLAWLEHLARRGAIVVFPTYPAFEVRTEHTKYDVMWAGFEAGLAAATAQTGVRADLARLTVVGHSFGGGAVNAIAARAQARGYGSKALALAPFAPWYDLDVAAWESIPPHAHLLAVAYADDCTCDPQIAAALVEAATTIPSSRKALRVFHSDDRRRPRLSADHLAPTTRRLDALDRGGWRALDALIAAAEGDERGRAVAFGTDEAALAVGTFTDGTPIRPATPTWTAVEGAPVVCAWRCDATQAALMRRLLQPQAWSTLPLPPPDRVDYTKLPASERFLKRPTSDMASKPVVGEPLLKVVARTGAPTLPVDARERLESAGIGIFQMSDGGEQGTAFLQDANGKVVLWRRADDPHLVDAAIALAGKKSAAATAGTTSPK